ncbi:hypothetical protein C2G38_2241530 [Gigaspora rosea]|uniref:Uncharacterized protein n=1 Tax=Gigaspora rosea TaxID=44941 RepID=A0A397VW64_9GLOM|nr:hypothetical protein C2G38_2241530 [Gigaspora rosea]
MVSYVSLLVVIISVKNNRSCSTGVAKYKIAEGLTQSIKFKYFFPTDYPSQTFATGDIVFILGKYIVENSEPCFTVAYSSIVNSGNPNREFDTSDVPITIPHCTCFVTVNRAPKNVGELIHFGVETVQYNSVTGNSEVKMNITAYSTTADAPSIIDIIDDDIDSTAAQNQSKSEEEQSDHENINEVDNEKVNDIASDENLRDIKEEKSQDKKRKGTPKKETKGKRKKF